MAPATTEKERGYHAYIKHQRIRLKMEEIEGEKRKGATVSTT